MKKLFYTILFFTCIFAGPFDKIIKDSSGNIRYLKISGNRDFWGFLLEYPEKRFKLDQLVIEDVSVNKKSDIAEFSKFLRTNGKNLKNLFFIGEDSDFSMESLVEILLAIENKPISNFKWENQDDLDNEELKEKVIRLNAWKHFEKLSFKGTELDNDDSFFLDKIKFEMLKELNLSSCDLNDALALKLLASANNYPKLSTLILDDNSIDMIPDLTKFDSLKILSYFNSSLRARHFDKFIKKNKNALTKLEEIHFSAISLNKKSNKLIYKTGEFKINNANDNNFGVFKAYTKNFPKLSFIAAFQQKVIENDSLSGNMLKSKRAFGQFFLKEADFLLFNDNYALPDNFSLIGPKITKQTIINMNHSSHLKNKTITIIQSNISNDDLTELRDLYSDVFKIVKLEWWSEKESSFYYDHNFHHQMFFDQMHHMMMQQMQQNIQNSIPKF
jgi:hypothetical protein